MRPDDARRLDVVILPGLDGTTAMLDDFCAALGTHGVAARAIGYPRDRAWGYGQLEPFVRERLSGAQPFVLLGESFSGPLALRIAAAPPPGLAGLVLSTTFARAPVRGLSPFAPLVRFAPARPPMAVLSWALLGEWATPALESRLATALATVDPAVLRCRAAAALRVDVAACLPSVAIPVLQLVASHDRLLSGAASAALAAGLANVRRATITGPHLLLQTATGRCAQEVSAFALGLRVDRPSDPLAPRSR